MLDSTGGSNVAISPDDQRIIDSISHWGWNGGDGVPVPESGDARVDNAGEAHKEKTERKSKRSSTSSITTDGKEVVLTSA